jgi:hypothetical protein
MTPIYGNGARFAKADCGFLKGESMESATQTTDAPDVVADPVSHISISGVHGRDELEERLENAPDYKPATSPLKPILIGVAIGVGLGYLLRRR